MNMKTDYCKKHNVPCTCTSLADHEECYRKDGRSFMQKMDKAFERLNDDDIRFLLDNRVRRVKWLYNNSNRMLMVYDEKMVRLIIQRLMNRNRSAKNQWHENN